MSAKIRKVRVQLQAGHPHAGSMGTVTIEKGKVNVRAFPGKEPTVLVALDDGGECYARAKEMGAIE